MKKTIIILALVGVNFGYAADKSAFKRKFERKMAAVSSTLQFGKNVSALITMEVDKSGKPRIVKMDCNQPDAGKRLKVKIENMQFNDTTCMGVHTLQLNIKQQK
jgi:hypothetical protein